MTHYKDGAVTYLECHSLELFLHIGHMPLSIQLFLTETLQQKYYLTSAEDFEGLANLAELKVDLCHAFGVLVRVEGQRQHAEFLCDLLEGRLRRDF